MLQGLAFFFKCLWPDLWAWWRCFYLPSQFCLSGLRSVGPFCSFTCLTQYFISPSSASLVTSAKLTLLEKCFSPEHTQVLNSRSTHQLQYFRVLKSSGWLITLHRDAASSCFVWADCGFFKQSKSFLENPAKLCARTVEKPSKRPTPRLVWETELLESPGGLLMSLVSVLSGHSGSAGLIPASSWAPPTFLLCLYLAWGLSQLDGLFLLQPSPFH